MKPIMTDERINDNNTIREILKKLDVRANAKLTDHEKYVMTKYNLERDGKDLRTAFGAYKNTIEIERRTQSWTAGKHHGTWSKVDFVGYFTSPERRYAKAISGSFLNRHTFQENQRMAEERAFRRKTLSAHKAKREMDSAKRSLLKIDERYDEKRKRLMEELMNLDTEKKEEKKRSAECYKYRYEKYKKICKTMGNSVDILA